MGRLMCNAMAAATRTISALWRMNILSMLLGSYSLTQGRIYRGLGGSSTPYSWCINRNMGRVREKKRWRKEEKWRERGRRRDQPPVKVRSLELRKEALDTGQRLKMKVESAIKFSPP
jgi:hypothetical protein